MAHKRRLGRGLESLIPTQKTSGERGVQQIPIRRIELNPRQPRQGLEPEALEGLASSIRYCGVIQPILVREHGDLYQVVAGERRLRAAKKAGLETIPAIIADVPDEKLLELALIENVQREDLNPIDKALAIRSLIEELHLTQEDVGERLGLSRPTITNFLRLLELPDEVLEMVSRGTLSAGHARALLAIEDAGDQIEAAKKIVAEGLSVREAEKMALSPRRQAKSPRVALPSPHVQHLERALQEALATKVAIRQRGPSGRIIVHFSDHDDFERIFEILSRDASDTRLNKMSA